MMWTPAVLDFPIRKWILKYSKDDVISDVIAGLTVFIMLIPQAMGYARLANMPAVYGLYTSTIPFFVYLILGTSRHLCLGPMGVVSLLIGTSCQAIEPDTESSAYIDVVQTVTLVASLFTIVLGFFKLGSVVDLLSTSVLSGFLSASALIVAWSNFRTMLGISTPPYDYLAETVVYVFAHLDKTNINSLVMGLSCWFLLYVIRRWRKANKNISEEAAAKSWISPQARKYLLVLSNAAGFFMLIVGALIAEAITKSGSYIPIVGEVPVGMKFTVPAGVSSSVYGQCIPAGIAIALIAYVSNWAITVKYANQFNYEEDIDPTQELLATGLANLAGLFFGGFYGNGGLGRTVVNVDSGAKTQFSGVLAAILIIIALLSITSILFYIPDAVLSAIILTSIVDMIDIDIMVQAYKSDQQACVIMVSTFLICLGLGVVEGLFLGVGVSVLVTLYNDAVLHIATLGKLDDTHFCDVLRLKNALQIPGVAIMRMDAKLSFLNSTTFKNYALRAVKGEFHTSNEQVHTLLIDMSPCCSVDRDGINAMNTLLADLKKKFQVNLQLAGIHGYARDRLTAMGFMKKLGPENVFMTIADALNNHPFGTFSGELSFNITQMDLIQSGQISANPYHRAFSPYTSIGEDSANGMPLKTTESQDRAGTGPRDVEAQYGVLKAGAGAAGEDEDDDDAHHPRTPLSSSVKSRATAADNADNDAEGIELLHKEAD